MIDKDQQSLARVAAIVGAYVGSNRLPKGALPDLIASVHSAVSGLAQPIEPQLAPPVPVVNPKKSVFPDYIICLEDGKRFKSMKRHLSVHFGLSPDQYRTRWNLASDYPMVAPNYAIKRSEMAKEAGLGRKPVEPVPAPVKRRRAAKA